jgi:hypothetical protein
MPAGRRPLSIDDQVNRVSGSPVAKARLRVILANLAGQISVGDACAALEICESWFFELKQQSLQRWATTLEPQSPGRRPSVEKTPEQARISALEEQVRQIELELKAAQLREELARKGLSRRQAQVRHAAKKASR